MTKTKKIRGTEASYTQSDGSHLCDLEQLAKKYRDIGNIPEHIGFSRAGEIALLAQAFLALKKRYDSEKS
jgi:hypothetical protein